MNEIVEASVPTSVAASIAEEAVGATGATGATGEPKPLDDQLAAAAINGDEAAFSLLFHRHRRMVVRLAYRFFHRKEEVEEIVQESFAGAFFSLASYQGGHEKAFAAWLSRITVLTCYDELRSRSRRRENALSDLNEAESAQIAAALDGSHSVEGRAISKDLATKLLARLGPEDRLVLTLLNVEEFSIAEIASVTGWSSSKVKMRAHRARTALRGILRRFV
jgi:RNA polymerase sigma-70 factor (ECF subfamily)